MLKDLVLMNAAKNSSIQAYGLFHILFLVLGLIISYLIAKKARKFSTKTNDMVLLIVGVILLLIDIYRQLFYYYINDNRYEFTAFPFQLSSMPMYFCIISYFLRKGVVKNTIYYFMATYNLFEGLILYLEASILNNEYLSLTITSFVWYMLLIFVGIYLVVSNRVRLKSYYFVLATSLLLVLCIIAFCINIVLADQSNNTLNAFFVGPLINRLFVFKQIGEDTTWWIATIIYIPSLIIGAKIMSIIIKIYNAFQTKHIGIV